MDLDRLFCDVDDFCLAGNPNCWSLPTKSVANQAVLI